MSGRYTHVFAKGYKLKSLTSVDRYIAENKHLPDIPSAEEVVKDGIELGQMDAKLLQKIEELTLYAIQQQKRIESGVVLPSPRYYLQEHKLRNVAEITPTGCLRYFSSIRRCRYFYFLDRELFNVELKNLKIGIAYTIRLPQHIKSFTNYQLGVSSINLSQILQLDRF